MRRWTPVLAMVAVAACGDAIPYEGAEGGPKVFLVGDSLTAEAADLITSRLRAGGDRVAGVWEHGQPTAWAAEELEEQVEADAPDVAIVAIGTNDWLDGFNEDDREAVADTVELLHRAGCGVWVVPAVVRFPEGRPPERSDVAQQTVEDVEAAAAAHDDVHVARWDEVAAEHPEWYLRDGVHHTPEGSIAFADFLERSRRSLCPT